MTRLPISTERGRKYHNKSSFSDYVTYRLPADALHFTDIDHANPNAKLWEISHLRYFVARRRGEPDPIILAFLRLEVDMPAARLFPDGPPVTEAGERLTSANSALTYIMRRLVDERWLQYADGNWWVTVPDSAPDFRTQAEIALDLLATQARLHLSRGPFNPPPTQLDLAAQPLSAIKHLTPIANCGSLMGVWWQDHPQLIFNTTYFLLEDEDYLSHHSGLGEAFNFWVHNGVIRRPPLYRRAALFRDHAGLWDVGCFDLTDLTITLPDGLDLSPFGNSDTDADFHFTLNPDPDNPTKIALYTRYYGVDFADQVLGTTPMAAGCFELTIVDRLVVGWSERGGLTLPQNGFVVSFAPGVLAPTQQADLQRALASDLIVTYKMAARQYQGIREAIQTGPCILRDGEFNLSNRDFVREEQFWSSRMLANGDYQIGIVPTDFDDNLASQHPRVGLGVDEDGGIVLAAVAGTSKGVGIPGIDGQGGTFEELAAILRGAGAIHAINLDGGGSAQVLQQGGRVIIPGERKGHAQIHFDRMVPAVGVVA